MCIKYEINNKHDDDDGMISCVSLCPQSTWKTASSNQESSVLQNWCECPEVSTNTNTAACAFPLHPHRCLSVIPAPIMEPLDVGSGRRWAELCRESHEGTKVPAPARMWKVQVFLP